MSRKEVFPTLVSRTTVGPKAFSKSDQSRQIFDVKFYPYPTTNGDQIFAATGGPNVFVCRPKLNSDQSFEILQWIKDDSNENVSFNSLVWMVNPENGNPLLCVAGSEPHHIKFIDVESGNVIRRLSGHGRGINDLAVSPLSTSLLTSAAEDYTIRIWNIEKQYEKQPCLAIFGGEGHREPILAIHYHPNGRWLLSGGIDTAVCLWAVPSLANPEMSKSDKDVVKPESVYYPYFYSKEVHPDYVDCLAFYGDLIISRASTENKAKDNEILIWRIEGFDSNDPPPDQPPIPTPGERTRSSFPHDSRYRGFQRILTLDMPHTDRFYRRFTLYNPPGMRPLLAMGNLRSEFHFWDLQSLEEGVAVKAERIAEKTRRGKGKLTNQSAHVAKRKGVSTETDDEAAGPSTSEFDDNSPALSDPFTPIQAHCIRSAKLANNNQCSTIASCWSPDGTWFVAVGDLGMICIFHRDAEKARQATTAA